MLFKKRNSDDLKLVAFHFLLVSALANMALAKSPVTLLNNVKISFTNNGTHTQFTVTSPLGNGISVTNAWLGIGLNSNSGMV